MPVLNLLEMFVVPPTTSDSERLLPGSRARTVPRLGPSSHRLRNLRLSIVPTSIPTVARVLGGRLLRLRFVQTRVELGGSRRR